MVEVTDSSSVSTTRKPRLSEAFFYCTEGAHENNLHDYGPVAGIKQIIECGGES